VKHPEMPTKNEIRNAVEAARAAGIEVGAIDIDPKTGRIKIISKCANQEPITDLDEWIAKHARETEGH
jgi:hypothetical protein